MNSALAEQLAETTGRRIYPTSIVQDGPATYFLGLAGDRRMLGVLGRSAAFPGTADGAVQWFECTPETAAALRERLPWLAPRALGLARAAGCGDRLGLATPGHVRAFRETAGIAPVFAQQSIRENARTGRSPQEVIDDAMWGVFQEGWRDPWGADADHLKTEADLDACMASGYSFFTLDPGDHVDGSAATAELPELNAKWDRLPWEDLAATPADLQSLYLGSVFHLAGGGSLTFSRETLWRAAAKYARALVHVVRLYRRLAARRVSFDLEVSVDETDTPTTPLEHLYIASELKRLGVHWDSLAPRYPGRFEKGVDYLGNLGEFEIDLALQAAVARTLGPYKLGIHSGSDKFSLYPIFARVVGERVHLKTAGTSYLEALRSLAATEPDLFRQIYQLAFERYPQDRLTYHVSADPTQAPPLQDLPTSALAEVLNQFDAREMLHVTFGSALSLYGARVKQALREHEEAYYAALLAHIRRHLRPLVGAPP